MIRFIDNIKGATDKIKKSVDIIKVVTDFLGPAAKESTNDHFWFCPFHNEKKNPSMAVHTSLKFFSCFGCHVGGDVVAFVASINAFSKIDAIEYLSEKYSIDISEFKREPTADELKIIKYKSIYNAIANMCHDRLINDIDFLTWYKDDTGFSTEQIIDYKVGKSTSANDVAIFANNFSDGGLTGEEVSKLDLANRHIWDNTIIYPICDHIGNALRFYGKKINQSEALIGKYIGTNSDNPLFTNGLLFGFNVIRKSLRTNVFTLRMVEGFKAAIASGGCATMGTTIHEDQVKLLKDHGVREVQLGYDGDEPGQAATLKAIVSTAHVDDISFLIAQMPQNTQPDLIAKQFGKDALDGIFATAIHPIRYIINRKRNQIGELSLEDKLSILSDSREYLSNVSDVKLDIVSGFLDKEIGISENSIRSFVYDIKSKKTGLINRDAEHSILYNILLEPVLWSKLRQTINTNKMFTVAEYQDIYSALDRLNKRVKGNKDAVTPQAIKDEIKLICLNPDQVYKMLDQIVITNPKYEFTDAIDRVSDMYRRRTAIDQSKMMISMMQDVGKNTEEIMSRFRKQLIDTIDVDHRRPSTPVELGHNVIEVVKERMSRGSAIIGYDFSSITDIDGNKIKCLQALNISMSGLQKGHQIIISANTGVGKSILASQLAVSLAISPHPEDQVPVLWIPLEMNETELTMRQISQIAGLNNTRVQCGIFKDDELKRFEKATDVLALGQLYIKQPKFGSSDEIYSIIEDYVFRYGIKVVIMDYIQLISTGQEDRGLARHEVIGKASKMMKRQVAEGMEVVSICVSQQNKQDFKAGELSSTEKVGGSYNISQDADDFMILIKKTPEQMMEENNGSNLFCYLDKRRGGTSDIRIDMCLDGEDGNRTLRIVEKLKPELLAKLSQGLLS